VEDGGTPCERAVAVTGITGDETEGEAIVFVVVAEGLDTNIISTLFGLASLAAASKSIYTINQSIMTLTIIICLILPTFS
jgi:hypothetical protein